LRQRTGLRVVASCALLRSRPGLELAHKRNPNMTAIGDEANCAAQAGTVALER
jgi:hypothetical protein